MASVRRALAWSFIGQFLSFSVTFGGSVAVARLLSPREMGVYAIASATVAIISLISTSGAGAYVVRAHELHDGTLDSAFTVSAMLSVVMAAVIYGASALQGTLVHEPGAGQVLRWLAWAPLIGIFEFRPATLLQREMQFKTISIVNTSKTALGVATTIAAAAKGNSYMSMAYGTLSSALCGAVLFNLVARQHAGVRMSLSRWRPIAVFGLRMISISGVATVANRLSDIILGRLLGLAALGLYGRASSMANLLFSEVYGAATRVIFVQLAADYRKTGTLRESFLRGLEMVTGVFWPIVIGTAVLARPLVFRLYGDRWMAAALPLSLLMVAQFVVLSFGMNWELFVLKDETARQTKIEFLRAVASVVTFTIGCLFSLAAAALGRVAEALVGLALYRGHVSRLADARRGEIGRIYGRSARLTAAAVWPSAVLMLATHWSKDVSLWWLAAAVSAGIGCWISLLWLLRHPLFDELRRLRARLSMAPASQNRGEA